VRLHFQSTKLQRTLCEEAMLRRSFGAENAKRIRLRLALLEAAPTLADVPTAPPPRRHGLTGPYEGCYAVDVLQPYRILLKPHLVPPPPRGKLINPRSVTEVLILDVLDYH
jgi:proteic killer suppression protein